MATKCAIIKPIPSISYKIDKYVFRLLCNCSTIRKGDGILNVLTLQSTYGGLLHDTGKAVYRAGGQRGSHSEQGYQFLHGVLPGAGWAPALDCVRYNHAAALRGAAKTLPADSPAYIVYLADYLSAAADRREVEGESSFLAGSSAGLGVHPPERYAPRLDDACAAAGRQPEAATAAAAAFRFRLCRCCTQVEGVSAGSAAAAGVDQLSAGSAGNAVQLFSVQHLYRRKPGCFSV